MTNKQTRRKKNDKKELSNCPREKKKRKRRILANSGAIFEQETLKLFFLLCLRRCFSLFFFFISFVFPSRPSCGWIPRGGTIFRTTKGRKAIAARKSRGGKGRSPLRKASSGAEDQTGTKGIGEKELGARS